MLRPLPLRELFGASFVRSAMPFAVGDKVVYPHHGAAIIEGKEKRVFEEKKTDYFVLRITYGDLKVSIPVDKAEEIGLRDVINDEEVEEVFAVLRKKEARMPTNWSRRFKNHVEKLKSGDIYQVAEVVRNLSLREADKGLSAGEKRMLARARQILVSELTFALNVDEETAESRLDDVLAGRDVPVKKPAQAAAKKSPAKKTGASRPRRRQADAKPAKAGCREEVTAPAAWGARARSAPRRSSWPVDGACSRPVFGATNPRWQGLAGRPR